MEKQERIKYIQGKEREIHHAGFRSDGVGGVRGDRRSEVVDSHRPEFETWSISRLCDFGQVVKPFKLHLPVFQMKILMLTSQACCEDEMR